jgi:hypothetical protein
MSEAGIAGAAPQQPSRCVHCGQPLTEETKDHVFPKSWYPSTTPPGVQRWTVPSCKKCNGELGKIERELFIRLALCLDPNTAEGSGLSAKAVRSMGIGAEGISLKESFHRRLLKMKIIRSMGRYELGTQTLPGLGVHPGFPEQEQVAIGIPAEQLRAVARKIVRGCEYELAGRIVEPPYNIGVYFVYQDRVPGLVARAFNSPGAQAAYLGPGFRVVRVAAHDEPKAVMYKITIWGTLVIYASILPQDPG